MSRSVTSPDRRKPAEVRADLATARDEVAALLTALSRARKRVGKLRMELRGAGRRRP